MKITDVTFRQADGKDVDKIMAVINAAKVFLHDQGIDQWQDGYPNEATINDDIVHGYGYVLASAGNILAYGALILGQEPTYADIYEGRWPNDEPYCVVHRLAVKAAFRHQAVAQTYIRYVMTYCRQHHVGNIRIDTHEANMIMQALIARSGFVYCGQIRLLSGAMRKAYQLQLDQLPESPIYNCSKMN